MKKETYTFSLTKEISKLLTELSEERYEYRSTLLTRLILEEKERRESKKVQNVK